MIEASGLTKRYGRTLAVDDLSFTVPPGKVTGFLGPNGAGKSTTMRMIVGLDTPTSGSVTVNGRPYTTYRRPVFEVGAPAAANTPSPESKSSPACDGTTRPNPKRRRKRPTHDHS